MLKSSFEFLLSRKKPDGEPPARFMSAISPDVGAIMPETARIVVAAAPEGLALQTSTHAATWHLGLENNWAADLDAA